MTPLRVNWITRLIGSLVDAAPSIVSVLLLPGGTVLALIGLAVRYRAWLVAQARPAARGLAIGVSLGALGACAGRASPPPAMRPAVSVITVRQVPITVTTELPGRVTAHRVADVRPQVNGVILKRLFAEGDRVRAGQQLYLIDPAPYEASLASARASLAHAHAALEAQKLTVERYKALVRAKAVSQQDYDNAVATLEQDEADMASAQASVRTAEINLTYTRVYSPISGRTGRSSVTEGALVTADQTSSLVTVTQLDPVYVDLTQPSTTLLRLKRELASGQIRSVGADEAPVNLILEDGTHYGASGTLQFSEVSVDQSTGAVVLRALFPNPDDLLLPGMFVRATIAEGVREGAILAPQQGITHAPDGTATALIVEADGRVEKRTVELNRAIGNQWLVTSGLAAGDRLIVSGTQWIRPGIAVTVRDSQPPHASGSHASAARATALAAR